MIKDDITYKHIEMLHHAAKDIDGVFALSSFGENPLNGKKIKTKVRHFQVGDVQGMAEEAIRMSKEQHRNVYAPLAVMRPDLPPSNKGSEKDVVAVLGFVADFDNGLGANYLERCAIKPSYAIETSPNNVQAGFLFNEPLTIKSENDRAYAKQLALKLTQSCEGADTCGSDLSHVWRISGLPNHPNKKKLNSGRNLEPFKTRAVKNYDNHNVTISDVAMLSKSPQEEVKSSITIEPEYKEPIDFQTLRERGQADLIDTIKNKHFGDRSEMVASVVSRLMKLGHGTGDIIELIRNHPEGIGERYNSDVSRIQDDVMRIASKWFECADNTEHDKHYEFEKLKPINEADIPVREWVLGNHLLKGKLSICIAPPGVGKSTLSLAMGLSVATNKPLLGIPVYADGAVAFINNEDDKEEMQRRFAALQKFHDIKHEQLADRVFMQSGDTQQFNIAIRDSITKKLIPHHKQALIDFCLSNKIEVLFVDPFLETHEADENDNRQINEVAKMYREVAQKANCAVCLIHHTRKEQGNSTSGHAGNMDSGRGASSLIGAARIVFTLYNMDEKTSKEYGVAEEKRHLYVRLDEAKGNLSLISPNARWFTRQSVSLENGESVGVLNQAKNVNENFENKKLLLEEELIEAILHSVHFEDFLLKGYSSKAAFASNMIKAESYLGSKTSTRSSIEKRLDKHLLEKEISHSGLKLFMTNIKTGKRNNYRVTVEMTDKILPPCHLSEQADVANNVTEVSKHSLPQVAQI